MAGWSLMNSFLECDGGGYRSFGGRGGGGDGSKTLGTGRWDGWAMMLGACKRHVGPKRTVHMSSRGFACRTQYLILTCSHLQVVSFPELSGRAEVLRILKGISTEIADSAIRFTLPGSLCMSQCREL